VQLPTEQGYRDHKKYEHPGPAAARRPDGGDLGRPCLESGGCENARRYHSTHVRSGASYLSWLAKFHGPRLPILRAAEAADRALIDR